MDDIGRMGQVIEKYERHCKVVRSHVTHQKYTFLTRFLRSKTNEKQDQLNRKSRRKLIQNA